MPEQKGVEPKFRGLEIAQSIFPRPAEIAHGFISHLIDKDQTCGLGVPLADALLHGTLAGANRSEGGDLCAVLLGDIRYGNRILVDIHANEECARRRHG
jgi:hypothetical protein